MEIRAKELLWTLGTVPHSIQQSAVSNLHLTWIGEEYVSNGFRSYVKFNEETGLLASGAGIRHSGNVLEIYDAETMELKLKHETDTSSCWCMNWLPEGHYVTGSNDSLIRIWTDGIVQHTYLTYRLKGHSDWIRCMTLSPSNRELVSGGMDSSIIIWDLGTLTPSWKFFLPGRRESMNSIMAVTMSQRLDQLVTVTREGCVALLDAHLANPVTCYVRFKQFEAHAFKSNHVELSQNERLILTSARDNTCKLWDLRKCGEAVPPLVTYSGHKCAMFPIPGRFYMNERYVLTGDDEAGVVVYDTASGSINRSLEMDSGVALTEPMDCFGPDFYCVLVKQQRLAILQVDGKEYHASVPTAQESEEEVVKRAMQKAIWKYNERIFHQLKVIGRFNMVGYGSLLDVLQSSAAEDEECRNIIRAVNSTQINVEYEANMRLEQRTGRQETAPVGSDQDLTLGLEQIASKRRPGIAPRVRIDKEANAK